MIHPEDATPMLEKLEKLGRSLGIDVRYEPLGDEDDSAPTRSGLCSLKGDQILLVDSRLSVLGKCRVLARELGHFNLAGIFIPPAVRRLIEDSNNNF